MIHSVRLYFVDIDKIELHHKFLHMVIVLEIENIDIDFCEFSLVGVINIDVRSMLECGPAPMTCYAHAGVVYFH